MPYSVGEKGSYGCSGYPAVKDDGTVMGCHKTAEEAANQIYAINQSEGNIKAGVGIKNPEEWSIGKALPDAYRPASAEGVPAGRNCANCLFYDTSKVLDGKAYCTKWDDYVKADYYCDAWKAESDMDDEEEKRMKRRKDMYKDGQIKEGDYVMGMTVDGEIHGRVEHIMLEGGTLGEPGTAYALESMPPENPAMSVRVFEEEEDGVWEPTAYSIGMMYQDATRLDQLKGHHMEDEENDMMAKAETYSPTSGMVTAARRALKWKADGKATGAGTPVGWGRASDIVAGRAMSLSVVKRMYSFFSRHEVDKKGKDFNNTANPSNGRIMWDAWGGDAGFSWSRGIVERMRDKALFADFGKDYTKSTRMVVKAIGVGSMVSWNSSGGRASGKITRIIRNGSYNVPGTDVTINGTPDNPAAVIRLYRDGKPTDTIVSHRMNTLRSA